MARLALPSHCAWEMLLGFALLLLADDTKPQEAGSRSICSTELLHSVGSGEMAPTQPWCKDRAVGSCNAHPIPLGILQLPHESIPNLRVLSQLCLQLVETRRASANKCPPESQSAAEGWKAEM